MSSRILIADSLENPDRCAGLRRRAARHLFHGPGSATARVAAVIRYAAGLLDEVPATVELLQPSRAGG